MIDFVFDGPPGPESPGFVEVENEDGKSVSVGEWVEREDGYWCLRIEPEGIPSLIEKNGFIEKEYRVRVREENDEE